MTSPASDPTIVQVGLSSVANRPSSPELGLGLPSELIVLILACLDLQTLLKCKQSCRFLKSLIEENLSLQYKIELSVAGMEDGRNCTLSVAERLSRLKRLQQSWLELRWSEEQTLVKSSRRVWEIAGGVWGCTTGPRGLFFAQLPSVLRGISSREWSIQDVGFTIRDFTIDPSQDLLVILELSNSAGHPRSLYFLSLSSGRPHPLSIAPGIIHVQGGPRALPHPRTFNIQICAEFVAMMIFYEAGVAELMVYDWRQLKTSMALGVFSHFPQHLVSFAFLSTSLLLVSSFSEDYAYPQLKVYNLGSAHEREASVDDPCLCTFGFPMTHYEAVFMDVSIRVDPSPSPSPGPSSGVPFCTSIAHRLIVIAITIARQTDIVALTIVAPVQTFLDRTHLLETYFPWDKWGPSGTCLLFLPTSDIWVRCVYGSRLAVVTSSPTAVFWVFDFNQLAVRRMASTSDHGQIVASWDKYGEAEGDEGFRIVLEPSIIRRCEKIFLEDIPTSLPYTVTSSRIDKHGEDRSYIFAAMVNPDSVILAEEGYDETRNNRILVF
ncbi:hypothetical protein JAAARDRAFT_28021 [Jaapia argillacea MUCL 33604]|uniref:F-box domain-containing protein n=1 Tax=Jaapia argillacea MUCL 33604 TaxID=933084 RepID=A0A067QBE6_9AGAM|nr:hypothetical protein JAAARDRAFT_28021 [Jaapia argillacea MUCL 33604]